MGGEPYWYVVPYEADINVALQKLRQREFQAGRYNPVISFLDFPIDANSPSPGPQHASIDEVLDTANEDGTRSILDLAQVSPVPFDGSQTPFMTVFPLGESARLDLFGVVNPTRQMVENCQDLWEDLQRGSGVYVVLYSGGKPHEIFFAGYSYD